MKFLNSTRIGQFDTKNTWKLINNVLNHKASKSQIQEIEVNDVTLQGPIEIAESINDFFVNIGPNLAKDIPPLIDPFIQA